MVDFTVTEKEADIIAKIASRAQAFSFKFDRFSLIMDISAVHANGCQLKLEELLTAKDFDFLHDVLGIMNHIDRDTGQLENCFLPRYAS